MQMDAPVIIAYTCSKKKEQLFEEIAAEAATIPGLTCVHFDRLGSTQHHGLIHKRTDDFVAELSLVGPASDVRYSVDSMLRGGVVAVDNPAGIHRLVDRASMARTISNGLARSPALASFVRNLRWACVRASLPKGDIIASLAEFSFPVIIKRRLACGSPESHVMAIANDAEAAAEAIIGFGADVPAEGREYALSMFVQEFIADHGGVLFKLYSVGERVVVQARHNVEQDDAPVKTKNCFQFDSQTLGKAAPASRTMRRAPAGAPMPPAELSRQIAAVMRKELKLDLIGVDIIFDMTRGSYSIVDINYFPGYKGVKDANRWILLHAVKKVLEERQKQAAYTLYRTLLTPSGGFCGDMQVKVSANHVIQVDARNTRQILGKGA